VRLKYKGDTMANETKESKKFFFQVKMKNSVLSKEQASTIYDALAKIATKEGGTGFISDADMDIKVIKAKLSDIIKKNKVKDVFVGLSDDIEFIKVQELKIKFK
jgi:hypothetical protein